MARGSGRCDLGMGDAIEADGAADLRWQLDGTDLGDASGLVLWRPAAGAHVLELVDQQAGVTTRVRFEVRGGEMSATDEHR